MAAGRRVAGFRTRRPNERHRGAETVPDADLADLAIDRRDDVRVGGLVVDIRQDGFLLDDGTAHAPVVLRDEAADWIPLIEPEDAINVIGRVERLDDGALGVVVTDPGAIVLGSDPATMGAAVPAIRRACRQGTIRRDERRPAQRSVRRRSRQLAGRRGGSRIAARHRCRVGRSDAPAPTPGAPLSAARVAARLSAIGGGEALRDGVAESVGGSVDAPRGRPGVA